METMKWEQKPYDHTENRNGRGNPGAPTIKNHSVTYFSGYLYCFGGYDGRKNHMTLLMYSIEEQRWLRPHQVENNEAAGEGAAVEGNDVNNDDNGAFRQPEDEEGRPARGLRFRNDILNDELEPHVVPFQPYRHPYHQHDYAAGDRRIMMYGDPPPGRNGHSASLAIDPDNKDNAKIIIIGGWLGTGPLAASDMHVLDISNEGRELRWSQPPVQGTPPGACNMHSADYVPARREVYVFRGGNGREYLNDLHALNVQTMTWRKVETTGEIPQQRANHSSAFLEETGELVVFGGWNGTERLNDIHILDTETSNWTCPRVAGTLPHPRAGMTLTALRGRIYLFGGSGTHSKCFHDLQVLDRNEMAWLDVTPHEPSYQSYHRNFRPSATSLAQDDPPTLVFGSSDDDSEINPQAETGREGDHRAGAFTSSRADWRSRELAAQPRTGALHASPNPNDEASVTRVLLQGRGPGRRAGHTATAVNRKIYVFGGSCGADYLNDFFVLDTDPPPRAKVTEPTTLNLIERRVGHFFNDEEFSDVTFIVQGRRVYGHRMVLAIVSDIFRAMFTSGFRESSSSEIEITDCSYDAFLAVMEYIYTGKIPSVCLFTIPNALDLGIKSESDVANKVVDILELADRFFLDHLKQICEEHLQSFVKVDTVEFLLQIAQKTNSMQLLAVCEHLMRNRGDNIRY